MSLSLSITNETETNHLWSFEAKTSLGKRSSEIIFRFDVNVMTPSKMSFNSDSTNEVIEIELSTCTIE